MAGLPGEGGGGGQRVLGLGLPAIAGPVGGMLGLGLDGSRQWDPSPGTLLGKAGVCVRGGPVFSPWGWELLMGGEVKGLGDACAPWRTPMSSPPSCQGVQ